MRSHAVEELQQAQNPPLPNLPRQGEGVEPNSEIGAPTGTATYRITLGEQLALDEFTRFVDPLGNFYQLVEYLQADRIDTLPVARVVRLPSA